MSLETLKIELANVLMNIEVDIQAAETKATGANIHDVKACCAFLKDMKNSSLNGDLEKQGFVTESNYFAIIVAVKQIICRLNLLTCGNDCRTAEREAKKLFNPGKFPGKEE